MLNLINLYLQRLAFRSTTILLAILFFSPITVADTLKTLHFATDAAYPPFEYMDVSGQVKGFDIDVAKALCQQMKRECEFSLQSFYSLIPSLKLGKYDALIAAIGVTVARQQQVTFSDTYYKPSAVFVALKDKHYTLSHLNGLTIGVQQGSTFENYLHEKFGSIISIKSYNNVQEAFLDLNAERVDAVIADTPLAQSWLKQNNQKFNIIDKPIIDLQYFGMGYGIAINKNNPELLQALNQALREIIANGTYDKIKQYYFST